jgi:hypothetical protein
MFRATIYPARRGIDRRGEKQIGKCDSSPVIATSALPLLNITLSLLCGELKDTRRCSRGGYLTRIGGKVAIDAVEVLTLSPGPTVLSKFH